MNSNILKFIHNKTVRYALVLSALFLVFIAIIMITSKYELYIEELRLYPSNKANMGMTKYILFLLIPLLMFIVTAIFRRKLVKLEDNTKNYIFGILGVVVISWELLFDVQRIESSAHSHSKAMFETFIQGFLFCRLNMYLIGTFLVLRKIEMLKWVIATSIFSGLVTLFDGQYYTYHSLMSHGVFLTFVPLFVLIVANKNYTIKNTLHATIFNLFIVVIMLIVNYNINKGWTTNSSAYGFVSFAGELTVDHMAANPIGRLIIWPYGMFLWIFIVMVAQAIFVVAYSVFFWKVNKIKTPFFKTMLEEFKKDKNSWLGFKFWGDNSIYNNWKKSAGEKWNQIKTRTS